VFLRSQTVDGRTYLLLVESQRVDGRIKQKVIARLGRLDDLRASGELERMLASLGRYSEKYAVLGAHADGQAITTRTCTIGPALVFERLWQQIGIGEILAQMAGERRFGFEWERATFLTVLHRLFAPGSDRAGAKWKADYVIDGADELALHQMYRCMGWLGEALAEPGEGEAALALRTRKDLIEEQLFERRRDLFGGLELVFFDTTSIYFEGEGGEDLGRHGHSKDHRPDLKQMVVGVVLDGGGRPLCSQMWPGNTAEVTTLVPVIERMRSRFGVQRVCIVADRGMISRATMDYLEQQGCSYILGVRMRRTQEAREEVLMHRGRYEEVHPRSADPKAPSALKVKEVRIEARRYVVCLNEAQADKDRHDRQAIVAALQAALARGDKTLIGNNGYRKFVKSSGARFEIDHDKIDAEARYDGKWVLRTNTDLSAREVALKYKELWQVEAMFRTMKSQLATRPIFHKCDDTIRGHVFCSFLALLLRDELQRRLAQRSYTLEWADVIRDLDQLQEVELHVQGKGYLLRTEAKGRASKVFQACGVALPPTLRPL
jgi:transposase